MLPLADLPDLIDASESYAPRVDAVREVGDLIAEVRRLGALYWDAARARGLGVATAELPAIHLRAGDRIGLEGLYRTKCRVLGDAAITLDVGVTSWGDLVEGLLHEICHALEPRAGHDLLFRETLSELVFAIFGVRVTPEIDGPGRNRDVYEIDRRLCDAFALAFPWAVLRIPTRRPVYELLAAGVRRVADKIGAVPHTDDLAALRCACESNEAGSYRVRGSVAVGDQKLDAAWDVQLWKAAT